MWQKACYVTGVGSIPAVSGCTWHFVKVHPIARPEGRHCVITMCDKALERLHVGRDMMLHSY